MSFLEKLEEYIMSLYVAKSSQVIALKVVTVAIDSTDATLTVVTFDDGTTTTINHAVTVGDYGILLPSTLYSFVEKEFFEAEFTPLLTFLEAITALVAGKSVRHGNSAAIWAPTDDLWTFGASDRTAIDFEVVV